MANAFPTINIQYTRKKLLPINELDVGGMTIKKIKQTLFYLYS
jgi:hypothetical protein